MIKLNPAFKETWETWGVVQQVGFVALFATLVLTMIMILIYIWNDIDKQMERRHESLEQILRSENMKTKKEIKEWLLKNATNEAGDVDISGIDFDDRELHLVGVKAEYINNLNQEAKIIDNEGQKAYMIYNTGQKASRFINNKCQNAYQIFNQYQEAKRISNSKQKAERIAQDLQKAEKYEKPYNFKELLEK